MVETEVLPAVDPAVASDVLSQIDELLHWRDAALEKSERAGIRLARLIADTSAHAYWTIRFKSERDFIEQTFAQSRAQYYKLLSVGSAMREYPEALLESLGMSKCQDLARIRRHCGGVIPENWFLHAKSESRDAFRERVRQYCTKSLPAGPQPKPNKFMTFSIPSDSVQVVNRAFHCAGLEAQSDVLSHLFVLICAEYCAGHNEDGPRFRDENAFHIFCAGHHIRQLNERRDPAAADRMLAEIRQAFVDLRGES